MKGVVGMWKVGVERMGKGVLDFGCVAAEGGARLVRRAGFVVSGLLGVGVGLCFVAEGRLKGVVRAPRAWFCVVGFQAYAWSSVFHGTVPIILRLACLSKRYAACGVKSTFPCICVIE